MVSFAAQTLTVVFQQLPLLLSLFFVGHITGKALELDSAGNTIFAIVIFFITTFRLLIALALAVSMRSFLLKFIILCDT